MTRRLLLVYAARNVVAAVVLVPVLYFSLWVPLGEVTGWGDVLGLMARTVLLILIVAGVSQLLWAPFVAKAAGFDVRGAWRRTAPGPDVRPAGSDPFEID